MGQSHLQRSEAVNPKLNAITVIRADQALAEAEAAEKAVGDRLKWATQLVCRPILGETLRWGVRITSDHKSRSRSVTASNKQSGRVTAGSRNRASGTTSADIEGHWMTQR